MLKTVPFDQLRTTDLHVDAHYTGGRNGNAGDGPLPALLSVDSQGGFRKRGKVQGQLAMLVLTSSMDAPDWPDALDRESGVFTYYGDNKKPGRELHETGRHGNFILRRISAAARRTPLIANRPLEWRNSREQLPQDREGKAIIQTLQSHFARKSRKTVIPSSSSAMDIVEIFRTNGRGTTVLMSTWLNEQFPVEP